MVSRFLFRLSRREMSWAANSAGSIGTISLGGRRVRFGGRKREVSLRHSFRQRRKRSSSTTDQVQGLGPRVEGGGRRGEEAAGLM